VLVGSQTQVVNIFVRLVKKTDYEKKIKNTARWHV